jgi:hypothetical protein
LRPPRRSIAVAAAAILLLLMSGVAFAQADIEQCFVDKSNAERAQRGLGTMAVNQDLVAMARRHSQQMADAGTIYHNQNLAAEGPRGWRLLGENVGVGPDCDSLHVAFMESPHHRDNILEPRFSYVGMGVVRSGDTTIYITEQFMQKGAAPKPPSPSPVPAPPPSPKPASPKPAPARPGPSPQPSLSPAPSPSPQLSPSPSPAASRPAGPVAPGPSPAVLGTLTLAVLAGAALAWAVARRRSS